MKQIILITTIFMVMTVHAQLRLPAQSPSSSIKQTIGLTEVEIFYSRPSVRERTIFGDLLPYNEFWRVGANAATKITFSRDVLIDGKVLKKGSYSLLAVPNESIWKLNWYVHTSTDWNDYVEADPVIELNVPLKKRELVLESLELHFQDVTMESATLLLEWERSRLEIPILVDEKEQISKDIIQTLAGPDIFDYYAAALYLHENQTELVRALEYIQKVTQSPKAMFFVVTREALILQDLGKNEEAKKIAKRALALSQKANNKDFIRINQKIINQ
ncbi:DUF2911 domain-containing protein [Maribacter algarum]|uniref:DUF2911 domain-containing protein n=1 Tax=Maribacter algarum (ex Zhang et al. 2020) TaxID=2578118 RepID=A0A5S3PQW4_9FLAO|nr:DUF2911 domain-containing protein [Maribacter algarum]TMM57137.1 DUF2911 domain-containing protein [Maribacter algarum]